MPDQGVEGSASALLGQARGARRVGECRVGVFVAGRRPGLVVRAARGDVGLLHRLDFFFIVDQLFLVQGEERRRPGALVYASHAAPNGGVAVGAGSLERGGGSLRLVRWRGAGLLE